jgi:hypothetical protein
MILKLHLLVGRAVNRVSITNIFCYPGKQWVHER